MDTLQRHFPTVEDSGMLSKSPIKEFESIVGTQNVFRDPADLLTCSYDAAVLEPIIPALAVDGAWCRNQSDFAACTATIKEVWPKPDCRQTPDSNLRREDWLS